MMEKNVKMTIIRDDILGITQRPVEESEDCKFQGVRVNNRSEGESLSRSAHLSR